MGIITDTLGIIDSAIGNIAQQGFETGAGSVGTVITVGSGLLIALMGANVIAQIRPMTMASFVAFGVKIGLIGIFAQSWGNFSVIYAILTDVPQSIGNAALGVTDLGNAETLYQSLDLMLSRITEYGDRVGDNAGWVFGAMLGVAFYLMAAIFAAVSAGIIAFASIMLTVMIVVAPFAIICSMFQATKSIFESWSRSTVGYAVMPIVIGAVLGIVVSAGEQTLSIVTEPEAVEEISLMLPFLAIMLLSVGVMATIPTVAQNISGAFGLASNATGLTNLAREGMIRGTQLGAGLVSGGAGYAAGAAVRTATGSSPMELRTAVRDGVSDGLRQRSVSEGRHSAASTLAMQKEWREKRREFAARRSAGADGLMARPGGASAPGAGRPSTPPRSTPPKPSPTTPTRGATP